MYQIPGQVEYLKGINTISVPRNIGYGRIRFLFFHTTFTTFKAVITELLNAREEEKDEKRSKFKI
jgi:hypothetical protein